MAGDAAGGVGGAEEDVRVNGKKIGRNDPCVTLVVATVIGLAGGYCSIAGSTLRPGSR